MASITAKVYNHGAALSTSYAAIYTVPSATQGFVPRIHLKNSDTSARVINISLNTNGSDVEYCQFTMPVGGSAMVTCMDIEDADIIKAKADAGSVVFAWVEVGEYA